MNYDTFQERLKLVMGGESNHSFAIKCSISEGTLRNYLKGGTSPDLKALQVIANVSGYSLAWLASGEGEMRRDPDLPPGAVRPLIWENEEDLGDDYYLIPRYDVHADCGSGAVVESEQVLEPWLLLRVG